MPKKWVKHQMRVGNDVHTIEIEESVPAKKRMQFSQKICVYGVILVTLAWLSNFALLWFGREPMSDVVVAIITMFGGFATGGYFALSGVRDCSKNKHADKNLNLEE